MIYGPRSFRQHPKGKNLVLAQIEENPFSLKKDEAMEKVAGIPL